MRLNLRQRGATAQQGPSPRAALCWPPLGPVLEAPITNDSELSLLISSAARGIQPSPVPSRTSDQLTVRQYTAEAADWTGL